MIIRRETLAAALAGTTSDDSRYFLNAVQCDPAGHRVIATDGKVLIIATEDTPHADEDFPVVPGAEFHGESGAIAVSAEVIRSMIATMPKKTTLPILQSVRLGRNGSPTSAVLAATDLVAPRVATVDGSDVTFPKWQQIMTPLQDREVVTVHLAVDVLETLIKAAKAVTTGRKSTAIITFEVPTAAKDRRANNGAVNSALKFSVTGPDVHLSGAAMPVNK